MDEQIKSKALEIISSLQEAVSSAAGQLPGMAQDYILYGRAAGTLTLAAAIFCAVYFGRIAVNRLRNPVLVGGDERYNKNDWTPSQTIVFLLSFIASLLSALVIAVNTPPTLMVYVAPRVWLVKELASLVK